MKFLSKMATAKPLYRDCDGSIGNEACFIPVKKLSGAKDNNSYEGNTEPLIKLPTVYDLDVEDVLERLNGPPS